MPEKKRITEPISLLKSFQNINDPRINRTLHHQLPDLLVIGVCTMICGGEGFTDMETFAKAHEPWLRTFLELPGGIPSHDTFNRVFQAIDPEQFIECFIQWTQSLLPALGDEIVAVDGKALRRAHENGEKIPCVVSAWAAQSGLTLAQVKVDEKSNEITAIPKLLRMLDLSGCIVTIDAMGCQKSIAREVIDSDADYLLALKGNQAVTEEEVRSFFNELIAPKHADASERVDYYETVEADHGRIETRRYWITDQTDWFEDKAKWEGLRSFAMVESIREIGEERCCERRLFLSSIDPDARRFARACRSHWGIENSLHWTMDVTFREDESRARSGNAAENLAALRRLALNLLKTEKTQRISLRRKRLMAGWNRDYLQKVLRI
jgi:predicted transposase YbfD/YdcC